AESLKKRRLTTHSVVVIEPDSAFFLDAHILPPKIAKVSLVIDNKVRVHSYFNTLRIDRGLNIFIESAHVSEPKKIFGLFKRASETLTSQSTFHAKQVRIVTEPALALIVGNAKVAQTPLELRLLPESLKLITKRGTVLE
ncbi:MAG: hypothetical protein WD544_02075, partial [Patescibacteria group bacterium]